jgi:hypothetical protein
MAGRFHIPVTRPQQRAARHPQPYNHRLRPRIRADRAAHRALPSRGLSTPAHHSPVDNSGRRKELGPAAICVRRLMVARSIVPAQTMPGRPVRAGGILRLFVCHPDGRLSPISYMLHSVFPLPETPDARPNAVLLQTPVPSHTPPPCRLPAAPTHLRGPNHDRRNEELV